MCHYVIIILQACLMIHCNHTTIFTIHPCGTCDTTSKPAPVRRMPSTHFELRNIFNQPSMRRRTKIYCGSHQIDACTKMRASSNISCSLSWDYTIWQNIKDCKVHKFWCKDAVCEFGNRFLPLTLMTLWVSPTKNPQNSRGINRTGNDWQLYMPERPEHFQQAKASQSMKGSLKHLEHLNKISVKHGKTQQLCIYIYRFSNTFCWKNISGDWRLYKDDQDAFFRDFAEAYKYLGQNWVKTEPIMI